MLFTLKKIVGGLLLPLPALLLLIGIGIALLWFSRFQRTGKLCVSLGWLLLTLLSLQPVADSLLKPIEDTYPTWRGEQPVNYVVVLGGGGQLAGSVAAAFGLGIFNKILEPQMGAVLGKILILVMIILFIQKRPQGLFALIGRVID